MISRRITPLQSNLIVAAIAAAGFLLRLRGIYTDLWLDELWGWAVARSAGSAAEILFGMHSGANHHLNSLILYYLGDRPWWPVYRLHSLAAGTAAVVLMASVARRQGRLAAWISALLGATSYPLIFYSSEARGYALLVLFSLLSFMAMDRFLAEPRPGTNLAVGLCVVLGYLSHADFIQCHIALAAWSARRFWTARASRRGAGLRWLECNGGPLAFLALFYFTHVRRCGGEGAWSSALHTLKVMGPLFFGTPATTAWAVALAAAATVATTREVLRLGREGDDTWAFYAALLFVSPALLLWANPMNPMAPRYFLPNAVFLMILLSRPLAEAARRGRAGTAACVIIISCFCLGNGKRTAAFYADGRGRYFEAVRYMADRTERPTVTVGSEHPGNKLMVDYYGRFLAPAKRFVFYSPSRWSREVPQWAILHATGEDIAPAPSLTAVTGATYRFERAFRAGDLGGWNWFIYRRNDMITPFRP